MVCHIYAHAFRMIRNMTRLVRATLRNLLKVNNLTRATTHNAYLAEEIESQAGGDLPGSIGRCVQASMKSFAGGAMTEKY